jgi:hypothetical protein
MVKRILVILIAVSFLAASPALAVKRVPKKSAQQSAASGQGQNQTGGQQESGDIKRNVQPPPQEPQRRRTEPSRVKEKDRFIDENDDGINDRYRKPPAVKKKPKEEESRDSGRVKRSRRPR